MTLRSRLARRLRFLADRIDPGSAMRHMGSLTVALEGPRGWVLRKDGTGVPVWYRTPDYGRAWDPPLTPSGVDVGAQLREARWPPPGGEGL